MAKQIYYQDIVEKERKKRIKLSVYAYAYEIEADSLISDSEYDRISFEIDPSIDTGNELMDRFFREKFNPSTGMWIREHPELNKIKRLYYDYYRQK